MSRYLQVAYLFFTLFTLQCTSAPPTGSDTDTRAMVWHPLTLSFEGNEILDENGTPNPFLDFRLDVTFSQGDKSIVVPGFFAADGNAGETGATGGTIWKVHFTPETTGTWTYQTSFREGKGIAVDPRPDAGEAGELDGLSGSFEVADSDKTGKDFRALGRLRYVGERYLKIGNSDSYFLKGGTDSPENFLGYAGFDGTYYGGDAVARQGESAPNLGLHAYEPHLRDWKPGDPDWQGGKGKNIIGALNYLAEKGMNSVYMLTMNVQGDGDDVWPWTDRNERYRFDCSKLDQWNTVFDHMDSLGLMLHLVLQETENETLLDGGYLDVQRKLYLRELAARFSQHLAITWNLGEEHGPAHWTPSGQTVAQTKDMASYLRDVDPYNSFIVVHTHSDDGNREKIISPLLGFKDIEGPSIQVGDPTTAHVQTAEWLKRSADSSHQWVVCLDEIGPAWKGALPDADDPAHDTIRHHVLWGNLMAGGAGVEWYFGYRFAHNDLNAEDLRSRDLLWDQTRVALEFFQQHIPFPKMHGNDELALSKNAYVFAQEGQVYALYLPPDSEAGLDLSMAAGTYSIDWYDPRDGGELQKGSIESVRAGSRVNLGMPPNKEGLDWVVLLRKQ